MADGSLPPVRPHHDGTSQRVREFVRANPASTAEAVAQALGLPVKIVGHKLQQMVNSGTMTRDPAVQPGVRVPGTVKFTVAREPKCTKLAISEAERMERRREQQRAAWHKRMQKARSQQTAIRAALDHIASAKPQPTMAAPAHVPAETVEAFLARGGRVHTLPGFVHQPDLRRRGQQHFRQGGAA